MTSKLNRPEITEEELAAEIKSYCEEGGVMTGRPDDFYENLADAFFNTGLGDGYEIAREIEGASVCEINRHEMEFLDSVYCWYRRLLEAKTDAWVKAENITCPVSLGQEVSFTWGFPRSELKGEVAEIDISQARVVIKVPGKDGMPVIPYERLILEEAANV